MLLHATITFRLGVALLLGAAAVAMPGCSGCREKKEKVIDIETPNTDIEVERSRKDGNLDIKVRRKTKTEKE